MITLAKPECLRLVQGAVLLSFPPKRQASEAEQRAAWDRFIAARQHAERTGDINDFRRSSDAFAAFYHLFCGVPRE